MRALCLACGEEFEDKTVCPNDGLTLTQIGVSNLVGQLLDKRYQIVEILGVGRTGLVCKALQLSTNRFVAVKVMHRHLITSQEAMVRFQREAQAAGRLKHPNILVVLDFGFSAPGQPYMVTEFINGLTLGSGVEHAGPFPIDRALPIFIQLCDAMSLAHSQQVLHRDLRPSNILITLDPTRGELAKVIDFGFVKFLDGVDQQKLTQSSQVFGSPAYMCPEQVRGENLDFRSDVYAIGGIMYFTLTGRHPFDGSNVTDCLRNLLEQNPLPFNQANSEVIVPRSLERVVFKALSKERAKRQSSVDELQADLRKIARELRIVVRSMTTPAIAETQSLPDSSDGWHQITPSRMAEQSSSPVVAQAVEEKAEGWKPLEIPTHLSGSFRGKTADEVPQKPQFQEPKTEPQQSRSHELSEQFRRSAESRAYVGEETSSWLLNVNEERLHTTPSEAEEQQCQLPSLELMNRLFDDFKRYTYHFNLTEEDRQLMVTCTPPRKGFDLTVRGQIENSIWVISAVGHSDTVSFFFVPSAKTKKKSGSKTVEKILFLELKSQAMQFGRKFWFIDNQPLFLEHLPALSKKIFARLRRVSVNEVDMKEKFDFHAALSQELEEEENPIEAEPVQSPMEIITYSLIAALDALKEEIIFLRNYDPAEVENEDAAQQIVDKTKQFETLQKHLTAVAEEWVKILET